MAAPLLPDDANTVCHLWVNGGQLVDTKGSAWTEVGSVPRVARADLGFGTGLAAEGLGPFSSTARFETATVADANRFNVSNAFFLTAIFRSPTNTYSSYLLSHATGSGLSAGSGLGLCVVSGAAGLDSTTNAFIATESGISTTGVSVVSMGRRSGATYGESKRDLNALTWNSGNATFNMSVLTQSVVAILGGRQMSGWPYFVPFPGVFYELRLTTTDPGSVNLDALHNMLLDATTVTAINNAATAAQASGVQQGISQGFQQGFDSKVAVRRFFGHFGHH